MREREGGGEGQAATSSVAPHQRNVQRTHPGRPSLCCQPALRVPPVSGVPPGLEERPIPGSTACMGKGLQASAGNDPSRCPRSLCCRPSLPGAGERGSQGTELPVLKPGKVLANRGELVPLLSSNSVCGSQTPSRRVLSGSAGKGRQPKPVMQVTSEMGTLPHGSQGATWPSSSSSQPPGTCTQHAHVHTDRHTRTT